MPLFERRAGFLVHPKRACNVPGPLLLKRSGEVDASLKKGVVEAGTGTEGRAGEADLQPERREGEVGPGPEGRAGECGLVTEGRAGEAGGVPENRAGAAGPVTEGRAGEAGPATEDRAGEAGAAWRELFEVSPDLQPSDAWPFALRKIREIAEFEPEKSILSHGASEKSTPAKVTRSYLFAGSHRHAFPGALALRREGEKIFLVVFWFFRREARRPVSTRPPCLVPRRLQNFRKITSLKNCRELNIMRGQILHRAFLAIHDRERAADAAAVAHDALEGLQDRAARRRDNRRPSALRRRRAGGHQFFPARHAPWLIFVQKTR